jgi:glycosyltransferase involved in cell wall biosynthesis
MRLAWFTPWPPQPSGIAGRSADLVPRLAGRGHGIDVFVDHRAVPAATVAADEAPAPGEIRVQSAHDFVWRQMRGQYDLPVYQVGNSALHEFIWPYLFRWPGLSLLHDARLHHARGRALLSHGRADAYRTEFAWCHPSVRPDAAELGVAGFSGSYLYGWPMTRSVLARSRLVGVHARGAIAELTDQGTTTPTEYVALGEGRDQVWTDEARVARRQSLGVPDGVVVFGVFGALTTEKRIAQVLRAFAATRARFDNVMLLLGGRCDETLDVVALARDLGVGPATRILEALDDASFDDTIAAVDVCLSLRWPTSLETSGPWLRALAAARASIIVDHGHLAHLPTLDPRTWRPHEPSRPGANASDAVAVAVDIVDEDHSLRLAMTRLARDAALREKLGRNARRYWQAEHTVGRMVADVDRALGLAIEVPLPTAPVPEHLCPDPFGLARALTAPFGDEPSRRLGSLMGQPRAAGA